jgi:hypothetical protein
MAQKTETDLRELKDLIQGLDQKIDRGFVEIDKKIAALDKKVDLGFNTLDGKIDKLDTRIGAVETKLTKLDDRLWTFGGIALSVTLGSLLTVFIRYMFSDSPKF